jgi:hypothetical protein
MAILDGGSKTIEKIVRFFELCGLSLEDEEFEFEENMLLVLEEVLLELADDHVFQVEIEGGYVKNSTDLPTGLEKHYIKGKAKAKAQVDDDDDFEDEDEEPQPKKSSKRQPEPVEEDEDEEEETPRRKASREPVRETAKPRRQPEPEDDDEDEEPEPAKPARRSFRKSSRDEVI